MDKIEFLKARLDEREDAARDAAGSAWRRWGVNSVEDSDGRAVIHGDGPSPSGREADHIALNDPAFVLAEIAAQRTMVELAARANEVDQTVSFEHGDSFDPNDGSWLGDDIITVLIQPFADHPDFDPSWRS